MDDHTVGVRGANSKRPDAKYAYDAVFAPATSTEVTPHKKLETQLPHELPVTALFSNIVQARA